MARIVGRILNRAEQEEARSDRASAKLPKYEGGDLMEGTTYNGWENRETSIVNEHQFYYDDWVKEMIDNIAMNFDRASSYAFIAESEDMGGRERALTLALADAMKEQFDDHLDEETEDWGELHPLLDDLIRTATNRINWLQIAEHYSKEIRDASERVYLI